MTLIFAKGLDDFTALSDLATSRPAKEDSEGVVFPLHRGSIRFHAGGHQLSGLAQKMIIAANTLVLWAGTYVIAKTLINSILEVSHGGENSISLDAAIAHSKLNRGELQQVYSAYDEHDLILTSVFPQDSSTPSFDTIVHQVTDFVDRSSVEIKKPPPWAPDYLFHVVSRAEDKVVRILTETGDQSFSMEMDDTGPARIHFSKAFADAIINDDLSAYEKVVITKETDSIAD